MATLFQTPPRFQMHRLTEEGSPLFITEREHHPGEVVVHFENGSPLFLAYHQVVELGRVIKRFAAMRKAEAAIRAEENTEREERIYQEVPF